MSQLVEAVATTTYGAASALLPVLNTEAYAVLAASRASPALVVVGALAFGQTAGKLVLFETARRGSAWRSARRHPGPTRKDRGRAERWAERIRAGLARPRTRITLVLAAASLGLPPLAAVSLAAGASAQPRWEFALLCFLGRTVRFAVLVLPAAYAFSAARAAQ